MRSRRGATFDHASTAAPLTLPAHSSLFTGRFPPEHGVRDNGGYFLNDSETTLAEVLKARGYATGGFIAAYVLDGKWGISAGVRHLLRQLRSVEVPASSR